MKFKKKLCIQMVLLTGLVSVLLIIPHMALAAQPKPGDVIDASNVEQYKDYFPPYLIMYIKNGGGFIDPLKIKVKETEKYTAPESFMKLSQANKDKFSIDAQGNIQGDYQAGTPFPDPKEPNLAEKVMWNYYYRWRGDDFYYPYPGWTYVSRRKGGTITSSGGTNVYHYFMNRSAVDPKPVVSHPQNLFLAYTLNTITGFNKGFEYLVWRYKDPTKPDDMWAYIPTLRRTLRMVSTERANPIQGTPATWDDWYCFDGKIPEFTYKFLEEKPMLELMNQVTMAEGKYYDGFPGPIVDIDPWEVWDHYVIEIKSKNPRYPESKRIHYVIKDIFFSHSAETFDKQGNFWKGVWSGYSKQCTLQKECGPFQCSAAYNDFKTEYWGANLLRTKAVINSGLKPDMFEPSFLGGGFLDFFESAK
jgi:hypothetical protein